MLITRWWGHAARRYSVAGATPEMVERWKMDYVIMPVFYMPDRTRHVSNTGRWAAGGMGIAAIVFLEAEMKPGIEIVMRAVKLEEAVKRLRW